MTIRFLNGCSIGELIDPSAASSRTVLGESTPSVASVASSSTVLGELTAPSAVSADSVLHPLPGTLPDLL
jgi:hypothetical protein